MQKNRDVCPDLRPVVKDVSQRRPIRRGLTSGPLSIKIVARWRGKENESQNSLALCEEAPGAEVEDETLGDAEGGHFAGLSLADSPSLPPRD